MNNINMKKIMLYQECSCDQDFVTNCDRVRNESTKQSIPTGYNIKNVYIKDSTCFVELLSSGMKWA